jgi:hypothetical protein
MAKRTGDRRNRFLYLYLFTFAILLAVIGVLSWRLEKAEARTDITSPVVRHGTTVDRPPLFITGDE